MAQLDGPANPQHHWGHVTPHHFKWTIFWVDQKQPWGCLDLLNTIWEDPLNHKTKNKKYRPQLFSHHATHHFLGLGSTLSDTRQSPQSTCVWLLELYLTHPTHWSWAGCRLWLHSGHPGTFYPSLCSPLPRVGSTPCDAKLSSQSRWVIARARSYLFCPLVLSRLLTTVICWEICNKRAKNLKYKGNKKIRETIKIDILCETVQVRTNGKIYSNYWLKKIHYLTSSNLDGRKEWNILTNKSWHLL